MGEHFNDPAKLLTGSAAFYGLQLDDEQVGKFFIFKDLLLDWNSRMNLTAIEEESDIIIKHFSDSLSIAPIIAELKQRMPEGQSLSLVDVGTGAGFPGIPLKIALPGLEVTLLDALAKRVNFLNEAVSKLGLKAINAIHGRAEELGRDKNHRERYDVAVARAVAALPVLLEYCLPFVKTGGVFIAMKGGADELDQSGRALKELGGEVSHVKELNLPFSDIKRKIIVIKKLRQTPSKYPRKPGKPSKDPLI